MNKLFILSAFALAPMLAFADTPVTIQSPTGTGMTQSGTMTPPPHREDDHRGTGSHMGTGMTQSGGMMGSGAQMERETKGLMLAIGKLSPTDRAALVKMIRDYLVSKGIDPAKMDDKGWDGSVKGNKAEIKEIKKDTRTEIKTIRKQTQAEIKAKREAMRAKVQEAKKNYVGHVTLIKQ